jgi:uncharacterized protein
VKRRTPVHVSFPLLCGALLLALLACKNPAPAPEREAIETSTATAPAPAPALASSTAPSASSEPAKRFGRPFFYRVEGAGAKKGNGWVLGTVHVGSDPDEVLDPVVWRHFEEAKVVVLEADVGGIGPMDAARLAMLPPGQSLRAKLTPAQWETLDSLTGIFVPTSGLDRMKPAFALAIAVQEMLPKTEPMDIVIQNRAKDASKELAYLEGVEEQVRMLDDAVDAEILGFSLDHADEMKTRLAELSKAYVDGDEPGLVKATFDPEEMKRYPQMYEKLFYVRNAAWVPKLEGLFAKGPVFVAVGVGHLLGEKSVLAVLAKGGWKVQREEASTAR